MMSLPVTVPSNPRQSSTKMMTITVLNSSRNDHPPPSREISIEVGTFSSALRCASTSALCLASEYRFRSSLAHSLNGANLASSARFLLSSSSSRFFLCSSVSSNGGRSGDDATILTASESCQMKRASYSNPSDGGLAGSRGPSRLFSSNSLIRLPNSSTLAAEVRELRK